MSASRKLPSHSGAANFHPSHQLTERRLPMHYVVLLSDLPIAQLVPCPCSWRRRTARKRISAAALAEGPAVAGVELPGRANKAFY